jgi:hypothetical protein
MLRPSGFRWQRVFEGNSAIGRFSEKVNCQDSLDSGLKTSPQGLDLAAIAIVVSNL